MIFSIALAMSNLVMGLPDESDTGETDGQQIEGTANPNALPVSDPDQALLATIKYPAEMIGTVYARQPDVQDPTAISFDRHNRLYIAETHRFDRGIEDNRRNSHWVRDDIALKTTADRLAMYEKHAEVKPMSYFRQYAEKIRVLEDRDGDGKADHAQIFADGFDDPLDGTAAGVMAAFGKVYFACIPHLWLLEDTDGDGVSDKRESLQEGFGVSVSLSGHDLNGFALGPDGRIYFTIGDRGYHLETADGRVLDGSNEGAIFRMEPDGSGLEVVHRGLRNPKEIAFDRYGNAFSVDNNADMGDKARIVPMVEGADSGWRRGHQNFWHFRHAIDVSGRHWQPWLKESIWELEGKNRPAAYLPAAAHLSNGPSGLAYNPGTGLNKKWDNHFFVCDFKGADSAVIAFEMVPDGAGFELAQHENFITGLLNTDVEFGYDGKMYVSDYTGSWPTHGLGAVFAFHDPEEISREATVQVGAIFAEGFAGRSANELEDLLEHVDMRVRLHAQYELARDPANREHLIRAAKQGQTLEARLHGVWGMGQLARKKEDRAAAEVLAELCDDGNARVRGQAVQALGEAFPAAYREVIARRLDDANARNRMLAATALGKVGHPDDVPKLIRLLERNADQDAYLAHGAIQGLRTIGQKSDKVEPLMAHAEHASVAVRRGLVIALRKLKSSKIVHFLDDPDESIVIETIQAINDAYIEEARPALAGQTQWLGKFSTEIDNRIINAMFRVGGEKNVRRLLMLAQDKSQPERIRLESLFVLGRWISPPPVDPTSGLHRALASGRDFGSLDKRVNDDLSTMARETEGKVLAEVFSTMEALDIDLPTSVLFGYLEEPKTPKEVRLAALEKLFRQRAEGLVEALMEVIHDRDATLRMRSLEMLAVIEPSKAMAHIRELLEGGHTRDRQHAIQLLGQIDHSEAVELLSSRVKSLSDQPQELQLDMIAAAEQRDEPEVAEALKTYRATLDSNDPLDPLRVTLKGGDKNQGRQIFYNHGSAQCVQCHKGQAGRDKGGVAGPHLRSVGLDNDREYLLESLILPNAKIADGYSPVSLTLNDGTVVSGMLGKQDDEQLTVIDENGERQSYPRDQIRESTEPLSTMPPMGQLLTKKELRDLIEYLASLTYEGKKE